MAHLDRREFLLGTTAALGAAVAPQITRPVPARSGEWNEEKLAAFTKQARELGVLGLVCLADGKTIVSDGEVSKPLRIASVRKSILNALYGIAMTKQRINLDATMMEMGIDDYTPLTEVERRATVQDLLKARSGIYLSTAAETPAMIAARPKRGSHAPGTFWYYNNWDFNVLGEIYQRVTGHSLYTAVEHELAGPLKWRDFDPMRDSRYQYFAEAPRFPAYNLFMSARDLATLGQLYLDQGMLNGQAYVPASWVAESTTIYSTTGRKGIQGGYGYLWWGATNTDGADPAGIPLGSYAAAGNGGRYVVVLPSVRGVIAIQPNEQAGQPPVPLYANVAAGSLDGLIRTFLAAHHPV
jgi:CubicO group peptidase (beta-lactamase class C family)